jgi:hypothetical protein
MVPWQGWALGSVKCYNVNKLEDGAFSLTRHDKYIGMEHIDLKIEVLMGDFLIKLNRLFVDGYKTSSWQQNY